MSKQQAKSLGNAETFTKVCTRLLRTKACCVFMRNQNKCFF